MLCLVLTVLMTALAAAGPAEDSAAGPVREYRLLFSDPEELEPIAQAGVSFNKAFQDAYFRGFGQNLPEKVDVMTGTVWSVFWTYIFSIWPHEFGHWARARQLGGDFNIHGFGFPFPSADMERPDAVRHGENALSSIGGFEINNLMASTIHREFYQNRYGYADALIHAFIQEVYFPMYSFLIARADPEDPGTWTSTYGDPSECVLAVFDDFERRAAVRADGSVDPELVRMYNEAVYVNLAWTLLDPMLYRSAMAFGADLNKNHGLMKPWMLGKGRFSWMWGTQFNPSPLGYELYLRNYLRVNGKFLTVYFRAGRPYHNYGMGVRAPALFERGRLRLGLSLDVWDQDPFGTGGAFYVNADVVAWKGLSLVLETGRKNSGYLLGRRIDAGTFIAAGGAWRF